jgi:hypothetical protein
MRMKEDHMLNGQLKPGYNWQISTNNQFILNYSIHQSTTDYNTLPTHVKQFADLYGKIPEIATADAGYGSEENYRFLEEHDIIAYVKDTYFDKDCSDKPYHDGFDSFNLYYNQQLDCLYCPMGQSMSFTGIKKRLTSNGFQQLHSLYTSANCNGCPMRGVCHKQKGNRQIEVNHDLRRLITAARQRLTSKQGIVYRKKRPVEVEAGLLSIAHNLKKWSC